MFTKKAHKGHMCFINAALKNALQNQMLKDLTNAPRYHQYLTGNFRLGTCILFKTRGTASVYNSEPGGLKNSPPSHEHEIFLGIRGGEGECFVFLLEIFNRQKQGNFKKIYMYNIHFDMTVTNQYTSFLPYISHIFDRKY